MEKAITGRYGDHILREARRRYAIDAGAIEMLDGFESYLYEFEKNGRGYILRLGHSLRRSPALIQAEVDWINYLAAGGAGAARAIRSRQNRLVEPIDDGRGGQFLATAFARAPGAPMPGALWRDEAFLAQYGRLLGRMHVLSRDYKLPDPERRRPQWDDPIIGDVAAWLPASEAVALRRYEGVLDTLRPLPRERANYGLIHQDAHAGNFFVDVNDGAGDATITLFDFDDCAYSWYANDLAIVLFYAITNHPHPLEFAPFFLTHFLRGYRQECRLDQEWLAFFPTFLKLRELELYAVIYRSFDVDQITDRWASGFMRDRKERIEGDVPTLDLDFSQFRL